MNAESNISQELKELNSQLADSVNVTPYSVPAGYFEELAAQVLSRIKAINTATDAEELALLSPLLNTISKETPYAIPTRYFETNLKNIARITNETDNLSVQEELTTLSPLLSGLKKDNLYSLPDGYFEQINTASVAESTNKKFAPVVPMATRKWGKMAVAAAVIGIIIMFGIQFITQKSAKDPLAKVEKEIKKATDNDLNEVLELTGDDIATAAVNADDTKDLLKDIPENDLKEFLQETTDVDVDNEKAKLN